MRTSPLYEHYRRHRQSVQDYCGSLTRSDGGEDAVFFPQWPSTQTLLYDASWRALIRVEGVEARKWLNGMITANVRDLRPGQVESSFQLDPKGHILAGFEIACLEPDVFLLLTSEDQRAGLIDRLRRYVFLSKLSLKDESEQWPALRWRGPQWRAAWTQAVGRLPGLPADLPPHQLVQLELGGAPALALASAPGGVPQLEIFASPPALVDLWQRLRPAAVAAGTAVFERDRILSHIPRYGVDITAAELPQETGQLDRLDYTKGCYIGQEIVERIRARGAVHRHWVSFVLQSPAEPGAEVIAGGKPAGKLTSIAPRPPGWLGLGYIRDPHQAPGTEIAAGAASGRVETELHTAPPGPLKTEI